MNRLLLIALTAALTLTTVGVTQTTAQTTAEVIAHAPTVKIGWMNAEQAIFTCGEGAQMLNAIERFVETKRKELEDLRREAEELRNRLEMQASRLTDEALLELEEKSRAHEIMLQRLSEDAQRDVDARRNRLTTTISAKMGPVIEKVALNKGFDAILLYNPSRDAWVNPGLNVTEDVIAAYNQAFPVSGLGVPPAAKKP